MGDKTVFLAFPQVEILARGHSLEVADASALKHVSEEWTGPDVCEPAGG